MRSGNAYNLHDVIRIIILYYCVFLFREILLTSTEMRAVMGIDPRPNCLIFDEIDGAPVASIELLLKFVQGKLTPKTKKAKSQPQKTSDGCTRPVVCICNEPYAPTLR